jgi:hypothetical protein
VSERRTKGGYESGDTPVSEMLARFPDVLLRPGAGAVVPEPQDAAPRVPNLACPKCGEPETAMRFCSGGYSIKWGMCMAGAGEHFHRDCPRCTHRWATYDVLGAA